MTLGPYTIRNAGFADAPAVFSLIKENPAELLPRPISDIAQNVDRFLVAEKDGLIIGAVSWQVLPDMVVGTISWAVAALPQQWPWLRQSRPVMPVEQYVIMAARQKRVDLARGTWSELGCSRMLS
jgi:hypothetical protein